MRLRDYKDKETMKIVEMLMKRHVSSYEKEDVLKGLDDDQVARVYAMLGKMAHNAGWESNKYQAKAEGQTKGAKILKWSTRLSSIVCAVAFPLAMKANEAGFATTAGGIIAGLVAPQMLGVVIKKITRKRNLNKCQEFNGTKKAIVNTMKFVANVRPKCVADCGPIL